jgi:hypothetical protein
VGLDEEVKPKRPETRLEEGHVRQMNRKHRENWSNQIRWGRK